VVSVDRSEPSAKALRGPDFKDESSVLSILGDKTSFSKCTFRARSHQVVNYMQIFDFEGVNNMPQGGKRTENVQFFE
jgi:hypothetical protein